MKPNYGTHPVALTRSTLSDPQPRSRWYHPKPLSRSLGFSLLLFGNIVVTNLPKTPAFAATPCISMSRGSQGESVTALQQTLNNNSFDAGPADGQFGELTEIALKGFQRSNNLDPDGVVGTATCTALIRANGSQLIAAAPATNTSTTFSSSGASATSSGASATATSNNQTQTAQQPRSSTPPASPSPALPPPSDVRPYQVVVPIREGENTLDIARLELPRAATDTGRLGDYVYAGSYSNRYEAEGWSNKLKARGLDARVVKR